LPLFLPAATKLKIVNQTIGGIGGIGGIGELGNWGNWGIGELGELPGIVFSFGGHQCKGAETQSIECQCFAFLGLYVFGLMTRAHFKMSHD
jgi:hypothetical protein